MLRGTFRGRRSPAVVQLRLWWVWQHPRRKLCKRTICVLLESSGCAESTGGVVRQPKSGIVNTLLQLYPSLLPPATYLYIQEPLGSTSASWFPAMDLLFNTQMNVCCVFKAAASKRRHRSFSYLSV